MRFKGKIDLWFWLVMLAGEGLILFSLFDMESGIIVIMILTALIYNLAFLPFIFRNYVEVTDDVLTIAFGFSKTSVALVDIKEVYRTKNPISSTAASLDRILIQTSNNQLMCAVTEREKFFACLKEKNPDIKIPAEGEKIKNTKVGKFGTIFSIVIIVIVGIVLCTGNIKTEFKEDSFVIKASYWYDKEIDYDKVESIEFRDEEISGSRVGGFGSIRLLLGDFNNKEFGNYTRYTYTNCDAGIILMVNDREVVLSGVDKESTFEIYEELKIRCGL